MSFSVWKTLPPFEMLIDDPEQIYQVGDVWVLTDDPDKATPEYVEAQSGVKISHNAAIDYQIMELERSAGGYNRGSREFMLGMALILNTYVPGVPDISTTPGMVKIKALDDQIKALRAQRMQ